MPAKSEEAGSESWVLDQRLFEEVRGTLQEGRTAFGDWMTNALQAILAEQQ